MNEHLDDFFKELEAYFGKPYTDVSPNEARLYAAFKESQDEKGISIAEVAEDVLHLGGLVYPAQLQNRPLTEREWAVNEWIPQHCVTGLYGDGGVGKSLLAMMLMTSVSTGADFLNLPTKQTKVFGYFCEDTEDELHRRQNSINEHYCLEFKNLTDIVWQSRVGMDNLLMTFKNGVGSPTEAYQTLRENVRDIGAQFVVVDTAADTFGGNENARPEVRQFINLLGQLALEISGAVILCAHPSRSGLADDSGSGGSTAWNNTLRSRLYLRKPKLKEGEEETPENSVIRELQKMKSNYSSIGDKLTLKWHHGAFELTDGVDSRSFMQKRMGGIQHLIIEGLEIFPDSNADVEALFGSIKSRMPYDADKKDERKKRYLQTLVGLQNRGHILVSQNRVFKIK